MAMTMPDFAAFKAVPLQQKVAILVLALVGIGVGFYFYVEEPVQAQITSLKTDIAKLDTEINTNKIKIEARGPQAVERRIAASAQQEPGVPAP